MKLYRESHLGKRLPAYDGRKSLYTAGPLPFMSKEFRITLLDEDDGQGGQRFFPCFYFSYLTLFCCYLFLVHCYNYLLFDSGERENSEL